MMIPVIINLLTSNTKPHFKCVGGGWGLNVCVWVGWGVNSALIQYCIQHSCELSLRVVLVSVGAA